MFSRINADDLTDSDVEEPMQVPNIKAYGSEIDGDVLMPLWQVPKANRENIVVAEVFSGKGVLADACRAIGMTALDFDLLQSPSHDMSVFGNVAVIKSQLLGNGVDYCHFAPPCNTYSAARFPKLRLLGRLRQPFPFLSYNFAGVPFTSVLGHFGA